MRFQWLKDYQELEEQILYLKWNLNKSNLELIRWTEGDLANVKLEKGSRSSKLEENIQVIGEELQRLEFQKEELLILVNSFSGMENELVKLRYIDGLTIEQVAEKMGYSVSHISHKHAEIRKTLDFLDAYESHKIKNNKMAEELSYYKTK